MKVDAIGTEIDAGCVDKAGGGVVNIVHGGQASAEERTL